MKVIFLWVAILILISCKKEDQSIKEDHECKDCRQAYEDTRYYVCDLKKDVDIKWIDPYENTFPIIYGNIGSLCDDWLKKKYLTNILPGNIQFL